MKCPVCKEDVDDNICVTCPHCHKTVCSTCYDLLNFLCIECIDTNQKKSGVKLFVSTMFQWLCRLGI